MWEKNSQASTKKGRLTRGDFVLLLIIEDKPALDGCFAFGLGSCFGPKFERVARLAINFPVRT